MVITTAQLHSTKPGLSYCAGLNPALAVSEIRNGEDLRQWSPLEIRLNAFRRSTVPQKQFIIIIIQTKKQKIRTYELDKILLSCFDDKRFVLRDGIHTLAYFHKDNSN